MADEQDLFGDNEEDEQLAEEASQGNVQDDLFGSDSEDENDRRGPDEDEDGDDADFQPKAAAAAAPSDLKSKLALLAQKKKREAEEEAAEKPPKKKRKKKDKEGEKDKAGKVRKGSSKPARARSLSPGQEEAEGAEEADVEAPPAVGGDDDEEDLDVEPVRTAEDDAFIDDEGVEPDDRASGESGGEAGGHSEAEEEVDDEFEKMFSSKGRKRREGRSLEEIKAVVESVLARMEVAAEADIEANEKGRPAVNKLKMLAELDSLLCQRALHREFMDAGVLGVLKAWIEPMPDMSLPNIKVRSAVLRHLRNLHIDTSDEGRRDLLKKSGLGRVVMFLYKLPDETPENRRMAKELVETWSRPVFEQHREPNTAEQVAEREAMLLRDVRARQREQERKKQDEEEEGDMETPKRPLRPGDPGFRWHASIPAPARLDYIKRPASKVMPDNGPRRAKDSGGKVAKRLVQMSRKKGSSAKKMSKVSVEGRGLII